MLILGKILKCRLWNVELVKEAMQISLTQIEYQNVNNKAKKATMIATLL